MVPLSLFRASGKEAQPKKVVRSVHWELGGKWSAARSPGLQACWGGWGVGDFDVIFGR